MLHMIISGIVCGALLGFVMQRGRFCLTGGFRDMYITKNNRMFYALLIAICIQSVGVFALIQFGLVQYDAGAFPWLGTVVGGFVFGIGIVYAGGCATGTWYRAGEGLIGSWIALVTYMVMSAVMRSPHAAGLNKFLGEHTTAHNGIAETLNISVWPIIALLVAFVCTLHLHVFTRRNLLIVAALALVLGALFFFTPTGDLLLARFEELGTQSGLRLSIWHHTVQEVASQPWLGRGFDYELNFTNYSGEHITTTHSVYLGALLKGGIIGLALLLAVIAGGLWQAWRNQQDGRYGLAIFIYALIFMASQGMFIISNPRESWPLFWLPLGIALSGSLKAKR